MTNVALLYTVRTYKRLATNPAIVWANTYELRDDNGSYSMGDVATEAFNIGAWEAEFHMTDVEFVRAVASSWVQDGQPYDPFSFAVASLAGLGGTRAYPSGDQTTSTPLDVCLRLSKSVPTGRQGYWLYRRCLTTADIESPAGSADIKATSASSIQAVIDAASLPGGQSLIDYLTNKGLSLVMAGGSALAPHVRSVTDINVAGVTVKDWNNAYFDRQAQ